MGEELDVDALKRRGRRRLIGAIALVLLAVLMLPMVFDPEPGPATSSVQVRIPGEGDANFSPKGESARTASVTPTGKAEVSDDSSKSAGAANPLSGAVAASGPSVPASSVAVPPPVATPSAAPPAAVSAPAGDAKDKSSSAVTASKLPQNAKSGPAAAASGLKRQVPASAEKSGLLFRLPHFPVRRSSRNSSQNSRRRTFPISSSRLPLRKGKSRASGRVRLKLRNRRTKFANVWCDLA